MKLREPIEENVTVELGQMAKERGLYQKYEISRTDGNEIDPDNEYFVLKLDGKGDVKHIDASRVAILTYADEIEDHKPELAKDLRARYGKS